MATLGLNTDNLEGMELVDAEDVIGTVAKQFQAYISSATLAEQVQNLIALQDAVNDLKSWHANYNPETGEIEGLDAEEVEV